MATAKTAKPSSRPGTNPSGGGNSSYLYPSPVSGNPPNEDSEMGFLIALISMVIVFALLLPLLGIVYLDVLEAKYEVKAQVEKLEKLRREVEQKHREGVVGDR